MQRSSEQSLSQKLLFITDVEKVIGRNRLTLRRWWSVGKFPKPIKLNGTVLAWHSDTVDQWINKIMNFENMELAEK